MADFSVPSVPPAAPWQDVDRQLQPEVADEDDLRREFGAEIFDSHVGEIAEDLLAMRSLGHRHPDLEDLVLRASLEGFDAASARFDAAITAGDRDEAKDAFDCVLHATPDEALALLWEAMEPGSKFNKQVELTLRASKDEDTPEDDPPVTRPRLSHLSDRRG